MKAYELALLNFEERDVVAGVQVLLAGQLPEHDGRYAPSAPQVARAARMALDKRLRADDLEKRLHPALPPPDVKVSPESRARVAALVKRTVANFERIEQGERGSVRDQLTELGKRTDASMGADMSENAMRERLLGYSIGSPESDREAS